MGCPTNHGGEGCGYRQDIKGNNMMLTNSITESGQAS